MSTPLGSWDVDGWRIRIAQGRKAPDDRRIDVAGPNGEFRTLSLAALGVITKLWFANEDLLYPPTDGKRGGRMVLDFLAECCESDVRTACGRYKLREPRIRRLPGDHPP